METYKIVLVIQDLQTKDGKKIAVASGDVHYHKSTKDKLAYTSLTNQIADEKDANKKNDLQNELLKHKHVASFQMALDSNKDFKRLIAALAVEAVELKEGKKKV